MGVNKQRNKNIGVKSMKGYCAFGLVSQIKLAECIQRRHPLKGGREGSGLVPPFSGMRV